MIKIYPAMVLTHGFHHGYMRKGIFTIEEVLSQIHAGYALFDGDVINMQSQRYQVFSKSITCVSCGIKATHFAKERNSSADGIFPKRTKWHFNLYTTKFNPWTEIMMTKDHIVPRSKGGPDKLENYQTMCQPCNSRKGNVTPNIRIMDAILQETRWNNSIVPLSREDFRLFKREFVRTFIDILGWDFGSDMVGHEERISYPGREI